MKKTLIATAVAAVMAAPAAMADITIGGQLQAEIVNASGDGVKGNVSEKETLTVDENGNVIKTITKTNSGEGIYMSDGWEGGKANSGNASAFFIKGNHDIGNGLTGLYKLNFNPKFGDDFRSVGSRDAFIGLKGGFGTALLGRLATPYKSSTVKWDPFLATFMQARGNGGMTGAGHNGYLGNVLAYANKFGPATVVAAIGLDETRNDPTNTAAPPETDGDHAISASVNVPVGPVELALAYVDTAGALVGSTDFIDGTNNIEAIKFGLKYGADGPLSLAAQYETVDSGGEDAFDQIYLTGGYAFGSNTVSLSYGITQPDANGADDGDYVALGLNHAFNKSISALVGVTKSDNADFSDATDDDYTLAGLSLRVKF